MVKQDPLQNAKHFAADLSGKSRFYRFEANFGLEPPKTETTPFLSPMIPIQSPPLQTCCAPVFPWAFAGVVAKALIEMAQAAVAELASNLDRGHLRR